MANSSEEEVAPFIEGLFAWLSANSELIQVFGAIATIVVAVGLNKQIFWILKKLYSFIPGVNPNLRGSRIFISSPMSDTSRREQFSATIHEVVRHLKDDLGASVFSGYIDYFDRNAPDSYHTEPNSNLISTVFQELRKCRQFILIVEEKLPTSAYVEIGFALAKKRQCAIFYKEGALPWMLKPDARLQEQNLRVAYYKFEEITDVSALVKKHGDSLFQ